jgi:hypothetical protein
MGIGNRLGIQRPEKAGRLRGLRPFPLHDARHFHGQTENADEPARVLQVAKIRIGK